MEIGNVSLQPGTMLLSSVEGTVKLTSKEFQVMELLIRRKAMITPKEDGDDNCSEI